MCKIVTNTTSKSKLEKRFKAEFIAMNLIAPKISKSKKSDLVPVIKQQQPNKIQLLNWSNILSSLTAKKIFQENEYQKILSQQRCIILCDGLVFFQKILNSKQAFYVQLKNKQPFAIAGFYTQLADKKTNLETNFFTMLTTPANELIKIVNNTNNKMPFILPANLENNWLLEKDISILKTLVKSYPSDYMNAYAIDNFISNTKVNKNDLFVLQKKESIVQSKLF